MCDESYAHSDPVTCSKCEGLTFNWLALAGLAVAATLVTIIMVQVQRHHGGKKMNSLTLVMASTVLLAYHAATLTRTSCYAAGVEGVDVILSSECPASEHTPRRGPPFP